MDFSLTENSICDEGLGKTRSLKQDLRTNPLPPFYK